ncbi:unnamed protein product [Bursaphelenchus xylophilus]|uniref:(pine wood nematode) hypothetical protein n=1 Tax=Bursaphelenchus xylophilus TaxID=6326 RepID=A0A1I7S7X5_BURXY|nr:unnamed protein product [Bursaphelenchus xylophilus]CAG9087191.1 unnamed protein product [Bursaphelenchus xylophilus]
MNKRSYDHSLGSQSTSTSRLYEDDDHIYENIGPDGRIPFPWRGDVYHDEGQSNQNWMQPKGIHHWRNYRRRWRWRKKKFDQSADLERDYLQETVQKMDVTLDAPATKEAIGKVIANKYGLIENDDGTCVPLKSDKSANRNSIDTSLMPFKIKNVTYDLTEREDEPKNEPRPNGILKEEPRSLLSSMVSTTNKSWLPSLPQDFDESLFLEWGENFWFKVRRLIIRSKRKQVRFDPLAPRFVLHFSTNERLNIAPPMANMSNRLKLLPNKRFTHVLVDKMFSVKDGIILEQFIHGMVFFFPGVLKRHGAEEITWWTRWFIENNEDAVFIAKYIESNTIIRAANFAHYLGIAAMEAWACRVLVERAEGMNVEELRELLNEPNVLDCHQDLLIGNRNDEDI